MSFSTLGLSEDLLQAVRLAGYQNPTPIQSQTIPLILKGTDVIAEGKTGTGKTACFVLPILQLLQNQSEEKMKTVKALIVEPTRELAMQVAGDIKMYGRNLTKPLRTVVLVGGLNLDVQLRSMIHGTDIVVATPGRFIDVFERQSIDVSHLKFLVIDEADKMFDLGFAKELESVLKVLPFKRQNLLFSATINEALLVLAQKFMPHALMVKTHDETLTVERVCQRAIQVNRHNRGPLLRHLIKVEHWSHVLIFVASVRGADMLMAKLRQADIVAEAFHGGLTQAQRTRILHDFKSKKTHVLVATDLASRGIDVDQLEVVVNYDLPRSSDDYIHRIGRTARSGAEGLAVTFIGHEDQSHFQMIEKKIRLRFPRESIKGFELTGNSFPKLKGGAPIKGHRLSKKDKARLELKKEGSRG